MIDTLGLLAEATDLAREAGHVVREEALGDSPGGACVVGGERRILVNVSLPAGDRLEVILAALAADPRAMALPMSRALSTRLARLGPPAGGGGHSAR